MGYYPGARMVGDYYPGRRMQGDIWSSLGKIGGTILKGAGAFAGGGILGTAISLGTQIFGGQGRGTPTPTFPGGGGLPAPMSPGGGINLPGPFRINPLAALPGGKPLVTKEGGQCPPGWHLNKGGKYPGTYCVRNRSMNPANPKALRRAIRREKRFIVLARHALAGTGIKIGRSSGFAKKSKRR